MLRQHVRDRADLYVGDRVTGYVQKVHDDVHLRSGLIKTDVSLRPLSTDGVVAATERILNALNDEVNKPGIIGVGDRSDPRDIQNYFPGLTKAIFKRALGKLYKDGVIERPGALEVVLKDVKEAV